MILEENIVRQYQVYPMILEENIVGCKIKGDLYYSKMHCL